ncbi:hypothetical protein P7C70_g1390, partial [Phenoliferia sp. Uapishka_3]
MSSPPKHLPNLIVETSQKPSPARSPSITGSISGSASPATRYGSFPPGGSSQLGGTVGGPELEQRLRGAIRRSEEEGAERGLTPGDRKGKAKARDQARKDPKRSWGRTASKVLVHKSSGLGRQPSLAADDVFDSDASLTDEDDERNNRGESSAFLGRRMSENLGRQRRARSGGFVEGSAVEKQPGVLKMEIMGRSWGRKGLVTIYAGVYLISTLMSLEANTTPVIEPYFLSSLKAHTMLGALSIVVNIAYAVGKPPMTKILDVFGRAEGVAFAASLYFLGYILSACATDVRVFVVARALAALGGQGLQLAQQIIIADTTTLTNRGLITSTISLPWLVTTWLGPPLGSFFQSKGEPGYRFAYGLFGTLLPLVSTVLVGTLLHQWRRAKQLMLRKSQRGSETVEVGKNEEREMVERFEGATMNWGARTRTVWKDLDVVGLASLTVGCILVLLPLTLAAKRPQAWADSQTWLLITGGICSLFFFAYYEFNFSPIPLLPPRVLKNRTIMCGSALGFFHFLSQFVYESFFTSFLQVARDHSPRDAAYISQSYMFSASIAAIIAGAFAKFSQRYRWIGITGVVIHGLGTWLMMRSRNLDSSTFELVISQMLGGIGGGFTTIAAQIGCQSVVGHQDVAIATTTFLTITQIGGAVGGAAAGAIWSTLLPSRLATHLPTTAIPLIPDIMASLEYTLKFEMGSPIRTAINAAYVETQQRLNIVAIFMLLPALACVCSMKNTHLEKEDQGQGEGVVVLGRASFLAHDEDNVSSETSSLLGGTSD